MIALKTYFILLIAIFILSLRTLNAPSPEVQKLIDDCVHDIETIFTGDVFQDALIALSRFAHISIPDQPQHNRCIYSISENLNNRYNRDTNIYGYYCSFHKYLLSDQPELNRQVPNVNEFCNRLYELLESPDECFYLLEGYYTPVNDQALKIAFYKYGLGSTPIAKLKIKLPQSDGEALAQYQFIEHNLLRDYVEEIRNERYIDVSLAYFDTIKSTFGLKIHSDNDEEDDRMLNPLEFCTKKFTEPTN